MKGVTSSSPNGTMQMKLVSSPERKPWRGRPDPSCITSKALAFSDRLRSRAPATRSIQATSTLNAMISRDQGRVTAHCRSKLVKAIPSGCPEALSMAIMYKQMCSSAWGKVCQTVRERSRADA